MGLCSIAPPALFARAQGLPGQAVQTRVYFGGQGTAGVPTNMCREGQTSEKCAGKFNTNPTSRKKSTPP
eukprot:772507-Alexandrium_andersonii.AAC.1